MRSRLYRTIVVFGATLGASAGTAALVSSAGCDLYFGSGDDQGSQHGWPGIDAAVTHPDGGDGGGWPTIADAPWGIIDAARSPDAGGCDSFPTQDGGVLEGCPS